MTTGNRREIAANRVPPSRDALILRVQEMAKKLHRQPCHKELRDVARIREDDARRMFGSYSGLLRASGFRGQVRGRNIDGERKEEMLDDFGRAVGRLGRFPTIGEYVDQGLFSYHTFKQAFKSWSGAQAAFVERSGGKEEWPAALRALVERQNMVTYKPSPDFPICGTVINYRAMLHEPTNEQGVVLLFGMMAEELGFIIENVRTGFPDCEGKRRVGENSWQRVRIEFEYLASRFDHPEEGCDVIICWRNDRPSMKKEIIALEQVLQLRRNSLPSEAVLPGDGVVVGPAVKRGSTKAIGCADQPSSAACLVPCA
ncbi:MAG: hypothetical protein KF805_11320 [Phycisphaeraceae bacterium]|nr:hypothetical protein [Phycisphaeraceae bacterium]